MKRVKIEWDHEAFNRGIVGNTVEFICRCGEKLTPAAPVITAELMDSVAAEMKSEANSANACN